MKILETIKQQKIIEVRERRSLYPIKLLEQSRYFETACVSLKGYIHSEKHQGIIAEFKRKSPSKGNINVYADVEKISLGYMQAGASALSVLTDETFFGAKKQDLPTARKLNYCPILRKDFIIDEYQLIESKAMGADTILLIAKILTPAQIAQFTTLAHQLGMEVLLEIHTETEILDNIHTHADLVGINNRNLNSFEVDVENSIRLAGLLPEGVVKIAESGLESAAVIKTLKNNGFSGFLIGEYFMKTADPAAKCAALIKELRL
ncbi:indole-3-glycerol phosphate synthase TrpC [Flavobacterium sp. HSC-61S13]|uniref:indole-3-glycerol phosphate synthase TrpC n=1 Tax=Flavobacterium sp. HSC-61S13 TaxID=2910963 RepID=UPI0020A0F6CB|nr:indole-3-glycerol phosphate synthase TrpC [Flavobacterium sp. HSC-61S13]MCP1997372.1 indole-3-glycerol phosphate synthase [Flavobacterium sp. HSC-61S13]